MSNFNKELSTEIYKWLSSCSCIEVCDEKSIMCVDNDDEYGLIEFHNDSITELSVINKDDKERTFYLHFQMNECKSTMDQFNAFFNYLTDKQLEADNLVNPSKEIKVLLSCSGGLSTTYFAHSMQEIIDRNNMNVKIDAVAYTDIDEVASDYDLILLAPQISYLMKPLKDRYGGKVLSINPFDFGTQNFQGILADAIR